MVFWETIPIGMNETLQSLQKMFPLKRDAVLY